MTSKSIDGIEFFYSKNDPSILLHQLFTPKDNNKRTNISPENQSLQVAYLSLNNQQTFKPHKHIFFERQMPIAQESWVLITGKVKIFYYDLDDKLLTTREMQSGDCTITYRGGHHYKALEEGTLVYEFKTGPYLGVEKDKAFI